MQGDNFLTEQRNSSVLTDPTRIPLPLLSTNCFPRSRQNYSASCFLKTSSKQKTIEKSSEFCVGHLVKEGEIQYHIISKAETQGIGSNYNQIW